MLGGDPWHDAARLHRRLAYVPGDVSLWPGLTGGEVIDVLARMRGGLDESRRADMVERFELDPSKKSRTYSKGNRQKVALVAALASRADLYLLDEPTSGLDPLMEAEFQKAVLELKGEGATVLLSSHILAEAEALSDRISIIRAGRVVQSGTLAELRHLTRTTVIAETDRPATAIAALPGVHEVGVPRGTGHLRRGLRPPRRDRERARGPGGPFAGGAPPDAGGAVPAPVRRRGARMSPRASAAAADPTSTAVAARRSDPHRRTRAPPRSPVSGTCCDSSSGWTGCGCRSGWSVSAARSSPAPSPYRRCTTRRRRLPATPVPSARAR